jgi:uncharacterized protein YcaQ
MDIPILTKAQARKIILDAAGLARAAQLGRGKEAVYRVIKQLGFVQLDTNLVVERAHHHVFASRVPDYQTSWLDELCEEGRVFEYFASDAGFMPMSDFRYTLPVKQAFSTQRGVLTKMEVDLMNQILDQVEREGPVRIGDFENDRLNASSGWWDWRPAKVALERLYLEGKLMIRRNKSFQKVYDLPLNFLPEEIDQRFPSAEEYAQYIIRRSLGALGVAYAKELAWRARRVKGNLVKQELDNMVHSGAVKLVEVEGLKDRLYMLANQSAQPEITGEVFILSPFDILNVFRYRLKDFFNFDYQLECFVPASKRKYGYFSLPILAGDTFVGRMDAKADRKNKVLIIHNLHFEPVNIYPDQLQKLTKALKAFVFFNQCLDIRFINSNNDEYLNLISDGFSLSAV